MGTSDMRPQVTSNNHSNPGVTVLQLKFWIPQVNSKTFVFPNVVVYFMVMSGWRPQVTPLKPFVILESQCYN